MFEISKHQLRQLNDANLRELVARLCEAELKNAGAPVSALKRGGAQTAPDKGLDIECCIEDDDFSGDFLPSARTGIQVKKSKMPDSKIKKEMSPKGQLRPVFSELARNNGCYIIVSLHDDLVSRKVNAREKTMREHLETIKEQGDLQVRFYGCSELANWLRQYPAVQLWVRERLGISLSGWKPFGRWSTTPPHVNDDLICEKGIAIILPGREREKLDILQGYRSPIGFRSAPLTSDNLLSGSLAQRWTRDNALRSEGEPERRRALSRNCNLYRVTSITQRNSPTRKNLPNQHIQTIDPETTPVTNTTQTQPDSSPAPRRTPRQAFCSPTLSSVGY